MKMWWYRQELGGKTDLEQMNRKSATFLAENKEPEPIFFIDYSSFHVHILTSQNDVYRAERLNSTTLPRTP